MRAVRVLVTALCRLLLRIYFRRIEVEGVDRVPPRGAVVFAGNHPNGLLDPLFVLCLAPRRVSFLAKEPLFRMPVVNWFVRAFECLPVYRRKDGADPAQVRANNRAMLDDAAKLLARGNGLALFPEGMSHDEPDLQPLRPGVARLALGAAAAGEPVQIVPVGLTFEARGSFRSVALMVYGEPIQVEARALDDDGVPPREAVADLTERVRAALLAITFTAPTRDVLELARLTEELLGEIGIQDRRPGLHQRLEVRRRVVAGIETLGRDEPGTLAALAHRVRRFHRIARVMGVPVGRRTSPPRGALVARLAADVAWFAVLLPAAAVGLVLNWLTYRLVGFLATRYAKTSEDVLSTAKALLGLLAFPMTWIVIGGTLAGAYRDLRALAVIPMGGVAGFATLLAAERLARIVRRTAALRLVLGLEAAGEWLTTERDRLRDELLALADRLPSVP